MPALKFQNLLFITKARKYENTKFEKLTKKTEQLVIYQPSFDFTHPVRFVATPLVKGNLEELTAQIKNIYFVLSSFRAFVIIFKKG